MNRIHSMYRILPRLVTALIVGLGVTLDADGQNRPPTTVGYITSINLAINQSTSFGVSGYFSDPDNDALEYSLKEDSTGLVSASISGSRVTLTAGSTTGSTGKIIVTATDPGGLDVSQDFNVTVYVPTPNRAPVTEGYITSINLAINGSTSFGVSGYFSDPDNDALKYSLSGGDSGLVSASISGSRVTLTAGSTPGNTGKIFVTATDPDGLNATQDFDVGVYDPDEVSYVTVSPSSATIEEGDTQGFSAAAYNAVSEAISGKTFTWSSSNTAVATIVSSTGVATGKKAGTATIKATVDGVSDTARLTVDKPPPPPPDSVTVSPSSTTLTAIGDTAQLSATVYANGSTITGASIKWSSDDTSVATVSTSGLVTAQGNGTATITAKATKNGGSASGTATVKVTEPPPPPPDSVTVSPSSTTLTAIGDTAQLSATVYANGSTITGASIKWSSDDTSVATVSTSGLVTAQGNGTATITAKATKNGGSASGTATVKVTEPPPPPPDSVTVSPSSTTLTAIGDTAQLSATVYANGSTITGASIKWSSDDTSVATVSTSGLVTAQGNGTATITAKATKNGGSASGTATVKVEEPPPPPDSVTVSPSSTTLAVGNTEQLSATVYANGSTITGASIKWSSDDTSVATVSTSGLVTAQGNGTATITAKATKNGGSASGTATVKVTETPLPPPDSVAVSPSSTTLTAIGNTEQLSVTVYDANDNTISGASIKWSSDDTSVATVSTGGLVTAKSDGTATITAKATKNGGSASGTATVTVGQRPARVVVSPSSTTLAVGGETTLSAAVYDANDNTITGASIKWSSDDTSVATVSTGGLVTAKSDGTATITAKATKNGGSASGTATVTVTETPLPPPDSVAVSPSSTTLTAIGNTEQLSVTVYANGSTITGASIKWSSDDTSVATVSTSGLVTAQGNGTATITAKATKNGGSASGTATVKVGQRPARVVVSPSSTTLAVGGETTLSATVYDANDNTISGASIKWSSDDTSVATVSTSGLVTAQGDGTATITAKATKNGGSASGTATVKVTETPPPPARVDVNPTSAFVEKDGTKTFTAAAFTSGNLAIPGKTFTWSSGNTAVATIDSSTGVATGVSAGTATIKATVDGVSGTATLTVTVPPLVVGLFASPGVVSEGAGPTTITVRLNPLPHGRSFATDQTVPVSVSDNGGSNAVGFAAVEDFDVTIPAGAASGSGEFTLTPVDDGTHTDDGKVRVSASAPGIIVTSSDIKLVDDDDPVITISAVADTVSEGTDVVFTLTASPTPVNALKVNLSLSGGSGFLTGLPPLNATVEAGSSAATVRFPTGDDVVDEPDGAMTVQVIPGDGYSVGASSSAQVVVQDNDDAPSGIALSASPATVSESDGATTVTVTASPTGGTLFGLAQTVRVSVSGSGVANVVGFSSVADFDVPIPAGVARGRARFTLTPTDNTQDNADETITIKGTASPSGTPVVATTLTLVDDDIPAVTISAVADTVSEGADVVFTLTASPSPVNTLTVNLTGTGGESFLTDPLPASATFDAGTGTATVRLATGDDTVDEADGTVTVQVSPGAGYEVGASSSAQVIVQDNDDAPSGIALAASPATVSESDGATTVTVTASPTGGTLFGLAQTVRVSVTGSGVANAVGFAPVADFDVSIPAGAASGSDTFTLTPTDNAQDNADETITIKGTASPSTSPVSSATLALEDDDEAPGITIAAVADRVSEGTSVEFTLTASPSPVNTLTVNLTGTGGESFLTDPLPASATFDAGTGTVTVRLATGDDTVDEADGTVTVQVSPGAGYLVGASSSAQVVVQDNDDAPSGIALAASPATVSESDGATTVTVTASPTGGTLFGLAQTVRVSVTGSGVANAVGFAPVADFDVRSPQARLVAATRSR